MIAAQTGRLIDSVRIDGRIFEESEAAGSAPSLGFQPDDVHLQNDGRWYHWMSPGWEYVIRHDGTGFEVTCANWSTTRSGHTYRLAGLSGHTDLLPGQNGAIVLDETKVYTLRPGSDEHSWSLWETDTNDAG